MELNVGILQYLEEYKELSFILRIVSPGICSTIADKRTFVSHQCVNSSLLEDVAWFVLALKSLLFTSFSKEVLATEITKPKIIIFQGIIVVTSPFDITLLIISIRKWEQIEMYMRWSHKWRFRGDWEFFLVLVWLYDGSNVYVTCKDSVTRALSARWVAH